MVGQRAGQDVATELPIILVIEDEEAIQVIVEDALAEGGFQIETVKTGEEANTLLKSGQRAIPGSRDRRQFAGSARRLGNRKSGARDGPAFSRGLHDWRGRR